MPVNLARHLLDTGILHFGRFQNGTEVIPFRFEFEYLPAYPDVLRKLVFEAQNHLEDVIVDRLVATPDALPIGVALSVVTNISLVYSRGKGEPAVHDLVGAYNSGHQALLLTNIFGDFQALDPLIADATRVGLEIRAVLTLVDLGIENRPAAQPLYVVARLADMVNDLLASSLLPIQQAQAVLDWIEGQSANRRPDAAVP